MKKLNLQKGFTVLESMFAIFILSLAVSGAFTAVQQGLSQAIMAKDEVRAYYIAQEGLELIRNKRDSNQIDRVLNGSTNDWLYGIAGPGDPCEFGNTCRVNITDYPLSTAIQPCPGNLCPDLRYDSTTGLYQYDGGETTIFRRDIVLEQVNSSEIVITVQVTWRNKMGLIPKTLKLKSHLFNWVSS